MASYFFAFTAPVSVVGTANLDDAQTRAAYGLEHVGTDIRGRYILRGEPRAFVNIIDHCLHMAADHGDEDPQARNAAQ